MRKVAVAAFLVVAIAGCPEAPLRGHDPALVGTWYGTAASYSIYGYLSNEARYTFTEDRFTLWEPGGTMTGTYTCDTSASPHKIDFHVFDVTNDLVQVLEGKTVRGRYGFRDGRLIVTSNAYYQSRPATLDDGSVLFISNASKAAGEEPPSGPDAAGDGQATASGLVGGEEQ